MKKLSFFPILAVFTLCCSLFFACSEFEPTGFPELPDLQKVENLKADIDGYNVNLSWNLPSVSGVQGVQIITNGNSSNPIVIDTIATNYTVIGQPMEQEYLYTVKVLYDGGYVSEGESVVAIIPYVELPNVTNLTALVEGRTVTLNWQLPDADNISGVKVYKNGDEAAATFIEGMPTQCVLKGQPINSTISYTVAVVYNDFYTSKGESVDVVIPFIASKIAYLMTAPSIQELPDDDERAAASWFASQENAELIFPEQIANIDPEIYPVIWIAIDRVGMPLGWKNLPESISNDKTISDLRNYSANGGSLYLSNMATQLTVPLGFVPEDMNPTVFGNGDGGSGSDVWMINPYLGLDFQSGSDQGFYDRTSHAVYNGLILDDPNGFGFNGLPLIGPGQREDHNTIWDCSIYGKGNQCDVIKNFEVTTNSLVLATWGHVRDHCVAGLVEFYANSEHGRCIANGFAAYEWNQNSGTNIYQSNIEKLTENILNYLK